MEGPGGYQFVGRTIQIWNRFKTTREFEPGKPWLLRFFDQIRFYPVSAQELLEHREKFLEGRFSVKIDHEVFRLRDYNDFLKSIEPEAVLFKTKQQSAFEAERERWSSTEYLPLGEEAGAASQGEIDLPDKGAFIDSPIAGNLWKILVKPGDTVIEGQSVAILESMKMEMQISAPRPGKIHSVLSKELSPIDPGQHLFIIESV
jgi:urea carboxylase